jgi:hypothetical protein
VKLLSLLTFLVLANCMKAQDDFVPCKKEVLFGVDNYMLTEKYPTLKTIKRNPTPVSENDIDLLKKKLSENPLSFEKAKNTVFRSHIAFVVNCNGQAGNFELLTKQSGLIKELEIELLEKVSQIKFEWNPATFKNEAVDCMQVLALTVMNGVVTNIYLK